MSISDTDLPELEPLATGGAQSSGRAPQAHNPFSPMSPASPTSVSLTARDLQMLMQQMAAATKAASEAAQAVSTMATSSGSSGTRGLESRDLLKMLPRPEPFRVDKLEDEHARWVSWYWQFRQYLCAIDSNFDSEISLIERDLHTEVNVLNEETNARGFQLCALLSSLIKGRAFQLVKQVPHQRGYEALRVLLLQFQPPSKVRSLGILSALTQLKGFNPKEVSSGEAVQSSLKSALLLRALSGNMRQRIAANLPENASYATLRETILRYERTQFKWGSHNLFSSDSVLLGQSSKPSVPQDEPVPMDIDRVAWKGKKGKGKQGKDGKGKKGKERAKMVKLAKEASPNSSSPARASHPRMARAKMQKARHLILLSAGHVARPATASVIAGRIRAGRIRAVFSRFQNQAPAPLPQARAQVKPQLQGILFGDLKLNLRMFPCLILPTLPCPMPVM